MLSGIKVIPREELLEEDSLSTGNHRRKTRRKEHHRSSSEEDKASKRGERRAWKSNKKSRRGTWSGSDTTDCTSPERENKCYANVEDKRSKHGKKRCSKHDKKVRDTVSTRMPDQCDGVDYNNGMLRKEIGLEWMLRPGSNPHSIPASVDNEQETKVEEVKKMNPKELNPYLLANGNGYPDDDSNSAVPNQLLSSSLVGDGGASWRLKALKRAKEQAAREGRTLQEVVTERWDSLQELAKTVAVHRPAPSRAHLSAIKERKKQQSNTSENQDKICNNSDYFHGASSGHPDMKKPKQDNLQWRSKPYKRVSLEDSSLVSEALSSINKFSNDGSFLASILNQQIKDVNTDCPSFTSKETKSLSGLNLGSEKYKDCSEVLSAKEQALSSNQLAAKVLRFKMKGMHEEAELLSKRMDLFEENSKKTTRQDTAGSTSRCIEKQLSYERRKHEDDADKHLAQKIMQNKMSGIADDEYDFCEEAPSRKLIKNKDTLREGKTNATRRILTQKERCQFCFENPSRPKHLVVSIGNVTYMMLPPWVPVIQGHCCILPLQHESSTRTIDRNAWEEIRNFKKCLLKMFSGQDKEVIFLETVVGLSRQRRHCIIECIPIPSHIAKQAPLYFKKAINEAEDEWGQHDMKKVIPTSGNLRNVIPENFSYFHVEFGLDKGFVHVIDDDKNFPSSFGLNVVRGMLRLPEETMHHHQRRETDEKQRQAVTAFVEEWEPFDWTRELD